MTLQEKLLDPQSSDEIVDDEFLREFAVIVGSKWPSLASLLSFTTAEVDQIKRDTIGTPAEQALHMLREWRRRGKKTTYGELCTELRAITLFRQFDCIHSHVRIIHDTLV